MEGHVKESSSPLHRFTIHPAKKFSQHVRYMSRYTVSLFAIILLQFWNLHASIFSPIATHDVVSNHTIHGRHLSQNGLSAEMVSSVQPAVESVVLGNMTIVPLFTNVTKKIKDTKGAVRVSNSDDSEDAIVVLWNHWTDLQQIVVSIFRERNLLFCDKINYKVHRYNKSRNAAATVNNSVVPVPSIPKIHVQIELSCRDLFQQSAYGTGNYIQAMYMMRLTIRYISNANVKLNVTCVDSEQLQKDYVLPWFTGTWYSRNYFNAANSTRAISSFSEKQGKSQPSSILVPEQLPVEMYCGVFTNSAIAIMYEEMQYDVRRMAIAIAGASLIQTNHIHSTKIEQFIEQNIYRTNTLHRTSRHDKNIDHAHNKYLSPGNQQERFDATTKIVPLVQPKQPIEFDDAVIHFRCGDVLTTNFQPYGFMTFDGYSRHISKHVRTIGILTQPFGLKPNVTVTNITESLVVQQRRVDAADTQQTQRCETLVFAFVRHLQERFPNATVRIRNDPSETIALAYSRMVMANQTVAGMSSFGVFPSLGTFGTGYFLRPKLGDPSCWLTHQKYPITEVYRHDRNIVMFDESKLLLGSSAKKLWDTYGDDVVLQWFRTGTYTLNDGQYNSSDSFALKRKN